MKQYKRRDEAVSPVIGVILMVAITVILAAVVGAFVFGMGTDVQGAKIVQITPKMNSTGGVSFMIMGGANLNSLEEVTWKLATDPDSEGILFNASAGSGNTVPAVGAVASIGDSDDGYETGTGYKGKEIIVIGTFSDGLEQVLLKKQF